jgi:hypothetical protein
LLYIYTFKQLLKHTNMSVLNDTLPQLPRMRDAVSIRWNSGDWDSAEQFIEHLYNMEIPNTDFDDIVDRVENELVAYWESHWGVTYHPYIESTGCRVHGEDIGTLVEGGASGRWHEVFIKVDSTEFGKEPSNSPKQWVLQLIDHPGLTPKLKTMWKNATDH